MQKARGHTINRAPTACRRQVSGLLTPLAGVLFTFPLRYWFAIGHRRVLSLGRWSSQIPTGFHVPRGTQVPFSPLFSFRYGALTLCGVPSQTLPLPTHGSIITALQPRRIVTRRFRLVPFRSPLLWESRLISSPAGTEMFHFPAFACQTYVFSVA